jgi:hypothetical protein
MILGQWKDIKCFLEWWRKHETILSTIDFLIKQILGNIGSQMEIEEFFSLVGNFTDLKRCKLQLDNGFYLIFLNPKPLKN